MRFFPFLLLAALLLSACDRPKSTADLVRDQAETAFDAGNYELAVEYYTDALTFDDLPSDYANRANCYSYLGEFEKAFADYDRSIELGIENLGNSDHPSLATLYYNRGYARERAGDYEAALTDYRRTIALNPEYPDARGNAAWVLATAPDESIRDGEKAIQLVRDEIELHPEERAGDQDTLAAAYAETEDFLQAVRHQERALELAAGTAAAAEFAERLALYEAKQPYRQETPAGPRVAP